MKGFIRTLEAVIASLLFLSTITLLAPHLSEIGSEETEHDIIRSTLLNYDNSGELSKNMTPEDIEKLLRSDIPEGYNFSARIRRTNTTEIKITEDFERYYNKNGTAELMVWIRDAEDLEINFDGETLAENQRSVSYREFSLADPTGYLNITDHLKDDIQVEVFFKGYTLERGSRPDTDGEISVLSHPYNRGNISEVQMEVWQE